MTNELQRIAPDPVAVGKLLELMSLSATGISEPDKTIDELVDKVILTDEETNEAIKDAKVKKYWRLKDEAVKQRRQDFVAEIKRAWTPQEQMNYLFVRAAELKINLVIDEQNQFVIEALCHYFTNSPDFVTMGESVNEKWSLDKGILLYGDVGTGKTSLMRLFGRNKRQCYDIAACPELTKLYRVNGEEAIEVMSKIRMEPQDARYFFHRTVGYCYDDLGKEEEGNHFGNKANVMGEILTNRYNLYPAVSFNHTHVTTNCTLPELLDRYGSRVESRISQMFNFMQLPGNDRRK